MKRTCMLAAMIVTGCGSTAWSDDSREPVEPVSIEEVAPTAAGEWSLRTSAEWARFEAVAGAYDERVERLQVFWGLRNRVSAEFEVPRLVLSSEAGDEQGLGNVTLGFKLAATGGESPLVLRVAVGLPTASAEFGERATTVELGGGSVWTHDRWTAQGGLAFESTTTGDEHGWEYGASVGAALASGWTAFAEVAGTSESAREAGPIAAGPALRFESAQQWSIGAAWHAPLNDHAPESRTFVQIQWTPRND